MQEPVVLTEQELEDLEALQQSKLYKDFIQIYDYISKVLDAYKEGVRDPADINQYHDEKVKHEQTSGQETV